MKYVLEYYPPNNEFYYVTTVPILWNGSKEELRNNINFAIENNKYRIVIGENHIEIEKYDLLSGRNLDEPKYVLYTLEEWFSFTK